MEHQSDTLGGLRTYLFVPGNHPRKVQKVFQAGADAVILDLEDAVANAEKVGAREAISEALKAPRTCAAYIRVNSFHTEFCYGDLQTVIGPSLDGIVLPKVESAGQLMTIDWVMRQLERERGLEPGSIDLLPIIETACGVAALDEIIAAKTRVRRLSFGAGDYTLDLDMQWTAGEAELADARSRIVMASRLGNLEPPIDTVVIHIRDHDRLKASARRARTMGFQGKLCIHPDQVKPCNEIFTPTPDEIEHARRVVEAFEEAESQGSASIQLDGYFIDYPIVYKARRVLALMARLQKLQAHA